MIVVEQGEDWWSDRSNLYSFDPSVLQELLYGRYELSAYERGKRHRAVASPRGAGRRRPAAAAYALLEIAQHYEDAGDLPMAARRLVEIAESTFSEGADRETACERAARAPASQCAGRRRRRRPAGAQRLLARAIVLLILGGETSWRANQTTARAARRARGRGGAGRRGDRRPVLRANARYGAARS